MLHDVNLDVLCVSRRDVYDVHLVETNVCMCVYLVETNVCLCVYLVEI